MSELESMVAFSNLDELRDAYEWQPGEKGIEYFDANEGTGRKVESGDWICAFYSLYLSSGKLLQSNVGDMPFLTLVGVGKLIKGWDLMVPGMKDGGSRRLIIPSDMAYGENPPPGIPASATLVFELNIVASGTPDGQ